jgi:FtsP/CotA-like multicopper oxidase with cupredoxin domain
VSHQIAARAGERIRLRLINASVARILRLRFDGHHPRIIALDGQPVASPFEPDDGGLVLGPAMRADVVLDMEGDPGRSYAVTDDFYGDQMGYRLTNFAYEKTPPLRAHPLDTAIVLPLNPVPEPDLAHAERHALTLQGGMMGRTSGMMGGAGGMMGANHAFWAINGVAGMSADMTHGMKPALIIQRGRTCIITLKNDTFWRHPMHLHGFSFRVIAANGKPVPQRPWHDTVLIPPREDVDIAFVADNPGVWMLHCHVIDHQESGMMTVIRVT